MTDQEAKEKWVSGNHLEKWRTMFNPFGEYITSGTQVADHIFLTVDVMGLTPFQGERVMQFFSRAGFFINGAVTVTFT